MSDFGIKDLNEKPIGIGPGPEMYKPKSKVDLTEIEKAMAEPAPKYPYPSFNDSIVNEIKASIKKLTHRQMRDMCKDIFDAHAKGNASGPDGGISKTDLPDVLDRFAHGD